MNSWQSGKLFFSFSYIVLPTLISNQIRPVYSQKMGVPLVEVVRKLQGIAPLKLAESWDNVGLLVDGHRDGNVSTVLLTIDLTEDVVDEALEKKAELIVSYHPNIFKPLKTVTQK